MFLRSFIVAAAIAATPAFAADEIIGRASVIDGDTIEIAGQRIRLNGIDAPESWQACKDGAGRPYRCGKEAAFALDDFLAGSRPTSCKGVDRDRYDRVVADCFRADGKNVNAWLVRQGWAVNWVRYSKGRYAADQSSAKAERRGIWRGEFDQPCEARAKRTKRTPVC